MAKLLVRVGVWLRAGLALTLTTVPVCPALGAQADSHALFPLAAFAGFQLPTISAPTVAPSMMSVSHDSRRHMTVLPGGGSLARAR